MRRTGGARQGKNRKAGFLLSRISEAVLRRLNEQNDSSIYWASNNRDYHLSRDYIYMIIDAQIHRQKYKNGRVKSSYV